MSAMASQITGVSIVYSPFVQAHITEKNKQSSASLAFVRGIHRSPVNSPRKAPVRRKMFSFDDVSMDKENNRGRTPDVPPVGQQSQLMQKPGLPQPNISMQGVGLCS